MAQRKKKMNLSKKFVLILATVIVVNFLIGKVVGRQRTVPSIDKLKDLPALSKYSPNSDAEFNANIQLIDNKTNRFFCSAVVVDDNYAFTAAHCLTDDNDRLTKDIINIRNDKGLPTGVSAVAAGLSNRIDFAILKGDFRKFKHARFNTYKNDFMESLMSNYVACGFPMGQNKISCTKFYFRGMTYFHAYGTGHLLPGMSGGPVYNLETGELVGVNSAVGEGFVIIVPLFGIAGAFGIELRDEK